MSLEFSGFEKAYQRLKEYITPTPLIKNEWLSKRYGADIYLKLENLQPVGSFKLRGATNMILNLTEEERQKGVVAVSAGNHAQGVAWAAQKFGIQATIIMPIGSPIVKQMNTEALGAKVILKGMSVDEGFEYAKEYLEKNNAIYVHPFNHDDVIYGQGSIGFELKDQLENIDYVFGSIGGGGLMTGVGSVVKHFFPHCNIIGTQSTGANSMIKSLQQGKLIESETVSTFADGIKVRKPEFKMYELLDCIVDEAIQIEDDQVSKAVLLLMEQARILAEGAGAINLAALDKLHEQNPRRFKNKKVVLLISGGNIDINLIDRIIEQGLMESKRRIKVDVVLQDKPGELNLLTEVLEKAEANILQVYHKRDIPTLKLDQSVVEVTMETRGENHTKVIYDLLSKDFHLL